MAKNITSSPKTGESRQIIKAASVIASSTLLSRVLGLVRDMVAFALFGATGGLDAFLVAFRLPNMLRSLFAEGSLTVSFIPVFVELGEKEGESRANELGRRTLTLLGLILLIVVVLGVLLAPYLVKVVAMGFARSPDKFALTVELTRIVFPYIGLIALTALLGGILNARRVFLYPALAPVVLNICMISASLFLAPSMNPPIAALGWGVIIGGCFQLLMQILPAKNTGFSFKPDFGWRDPALKKVFLLMGPAVLGVAVYQINLVVSTFLASWLPDGSISYLYGAERLFQLPLGVFAVSVGVASLPSLSRLAAKNEWEEFGETVKNALKILWFVVIPATVGLFILAQPIVILLFKRGAFSMTMAIETANALKFYALALIPVATTRIIAQSFYALKDTKTPVKGALIALIVNLAASLLLMGPMKHTGLALATALSAAANALFLAYRYKKETGNYPFTKLGNPFTKMTTSALLMGGALYFGLMQFSAHANGENGTLALGVFVGCAVIGGALLYGVMGMVLGLDESRVVLKKLRRR
jgi:putative peptidoglycan lipid II flippase